MRNMLFTVGPDRLVRGALGRRHLRAPILRREIEIVSPLWPDALDGMRIAHASDFHLGTLITGARALEAIALMESAEPDLVAVTGDVVDLHHAGMAPILEALAAIPAPLGTMLVLGNHDELKSGERVRRAARAAGIVVLDDARVVRESAAGPIAIAGIGWSATARGCAERVARAVAEPCDLLLAHNPRAFAAAARRDVALTLAGHTHGGQVALPGRPNANLAVAHRRSAGVFALRDARMHVTTGVGSWFPLRVNCPSEVVMLTMRSGAA